MRTKKSPSRLVAFTDAVVAIAITLLVLPLTDLVAEGAKENLSAPELIADHKWQIYSFLLSFVVIARLWLSHHQLFEKVGTHSRWLIRWNMVWLLFIVVLPFQTEMTAVFNGDRFAVGFYIAVVLASEICLAAMEFMVYRDPELATEPGAVSRQDVIGSAVTGAILLLALLLAVFVPDVYSYSLLLLVIPNTHKRFVRRRNEKRVAEKATEAA
ncbi:TMEM175 family protein [Amycolatopsis pigmentata]|uniref:TMEM175 family protein n=1 Tax=Amycolatopsis pigmentata TaxID=450801 RepID=A0ABW5G358_9PSEU